jgi:hypothetical protein
MRDVEGGVAQSVVAQYSWRKAANRVRIISCLVLLIAVTALGAVSTDNLRTHVRWLSDPMRAGRQSGQAGAAASAEYITQQFQQLKFEVQVQEFGVNRRNVVARWGKADKYIVIGAHYDGQGVGNASASDNAAGVAVLLELARELKTVELPVSLVAVAFDDEEQGLNGSRYFVDHPIFPLESAVAAIIFDTMGRSFIDLQSWTLFVLGTEYSKELAGVIQKRNRQGMIVAGTDLIGPRSDFAPFALKRIPYLFFSHATHKDYHGPGDTPERINYQRLTQDATLIGQIVRDIAQLQAKPVFLTEPAYPTSEVATLQSLMTTVQKERTDLPRVYALVFSDLQERVKTDRSRETLQVAAAALISLATPRFSGFTLGFILEPFYEKANKPEIVEAIREEAKRWQ